MFVNIIDVNERGYVNWDGKTRFAVTVGNIACALLLSEYRKEGELSTSLSFLSAICRWIEGPSKVLQLLFLATMDCVFAL